MAGTGVWDAILQGKGYPPGPVALDRGEPAAPRKPHWTVGAIVVVLALVGLYGLAVFMSGRAMRSTWATRNR